MGKEIADRLIFPKGQQHTFLLTAKKKLNMSWGEMGKLTKTHRRSFSDWVSEKYNMPSPVAQTLSKRCKINIPHNVQTKKWKDHLQTIGVSGRKAIIKKYGRVPVDEKYRQQKWREWWEQAGKYEFHPIINRPLSIKRPAQSKKLAEFVGIVLGDGGISQMQITITHHREDDKQHGQFIKKMIRDLFGIEPGTHQQRHALADNIYISRKGLVDYFVNHLGLKVGNKVKHQVDVPNWIKKNGHFLNACVRGLIDTDGSVFTHRYKVNGKWYSYKKLSFTNRSKPLREAVYNHLASIGLNPRRAGEYDIRLDRQADMKSYFKIVGSHNSKHLKRYAT